MRRGLIICVLGWTTPAAGDFVTPDGFGWSRGNDRTAYFDWEVFTSVSGGNTPNASNAGSLPSDAPEPDVFSPTPATILTGIGSIYSLVNPIDIVAEVPGFDRAPESNARNRDYVEAVVQMRTQGREVDLDSVLFNGQRALEVRELDRIVLGDPDDIFGGSIVETLFYFEGVTGDDVLTLEFSAARESMSLDRLSIDYRSRIGGTIVAGSLFGGEASATTVPGVGSAAALMGLCIGRRRR